MPLVAKRKLDQTWREAVAARGGEVGLGDACVKAFDAHLAQSKPASEAAYLALKALECLSSVPDGPVPGRPEEV